MANPENIAKAVRNVRDAVALYLKNDLGLEDEVITDAFKHLFDLKEVSDRCRGEMGQIVRATKENDRTLDMVLNAIQTKALFLETQGLEHSAIKFNLHLKRLDMSIGQLQSKPLLSPDEFIRAAQDFYLEFTYKYVLKK